MGLDALEVEGCRVVKLQRVTDPDENYADEPDLSLYRILGEL